MSMRDTTIGCRSLVCLLQSLVDRHTTIELRNETSVTGRVGFVDANMNVHLTDATFRTVDGQESCFEQFFIKGINIRFVHIPDDVDMLAAITSQLDLVKSKDKVLTKMTPDERKKKQKERMKVKAQEKYEEIKKNLGIE